MLVLSRSKLLLATLALLCPILLIGIKLHAPAGVRVYTGVSWLTQSRNYTVGQKAAYTNPYASKYHKDANIAITRRYFELQQPTVDLLNNLINLDPASVDAEERVDWSAVAVATAASENHYREARVAIKRHNQAFPHSTLYFYDLGLTDVQAEEIQRGCHVVYRRLDYSLYPPHVKDLQLYAFKSIIWQEMLTSHERFIWMDASIQLSPCFIGDLREAEVTLSTSGILMPVMTDHTVYLATTPSFYQYIPANLTRLQELRCYGNTLIVFQRTAALIEEVMKWHLMCSMDPQCAAPEGHTLSCTYKERDKDRMWFNYGGCHRYDQSTLNVLLAVTHNYNVSAYAPREPVLDVDTASDADRCFRIMREDYSDVNIEECEAL